MHKRKIVFVILTALLISGCNRNKNSSSSLQSSRSEASETTIVSESEISEVNTEQIERVSAAFRKLYLTPALSFETNSSLLEVQEKVFSEENMLVDEKQLELELSALTELTGRITDNVIFKQSITVNSDDSFELMSYYALETLYVRFDYNEEENQKVRFDEAGILNTLFGNKNVTDTDLTFIDSFISNNKSAEIISRNGKLVYFATITNEQISTLLAEIIVAASPETEVSPELLKYLFMYIMEVFFNLKQFTIEVIINNHNEIEQFIIDFEIELVIIKEFPALNGTELDVTLLSEIIAKLSMAREGARTEADINGKITTDVTMSENILIDAPANLEEYELFVMSA